MYQEKTLNEAAKLFQIFRCGGKKCTGGVLPPK